MRLDILLNNRQADTHINRAEKTQLEALADIFYTANDRPEIDHTKSVWENLKIIIPAPAENS